MPSHGRRQDLSALLGPPAASPPGIWVSAPEAPGVDIVADISEGIDLPDSSVGVIRAIDFLHTSPTRSASSTSSIACSHTAVCADPDTEHRRARGVPGPDHVAFYNENSFWYYTDPSRRFAPDSRAGSRSVVSSPIPQRVARAAQDLLRVPNLIAVKEGPRQGEQLLI